MLLPLPRSLTSLANTAYQFFTAMRIWKLNWLSFAALLNS